MAFNYRHLHYFWVVAHKGGMARAAAHLGVAVQTVSAQVRELERALGTTLLEPKGRGLALTDPGRAALRQADLIFELGEELPRVVRDSVRPAAMRLSVGVADPVAKLSAHRLMLPAMRERRTRLICHADNFDRLLGDLGLHRIDAVIADRPAPSGGSLRLFSHLAAASPLGWYAAGAALRSARGGFPSMLASLPVLLPTGHAAVRAAVDLWFERHGITPEIFGEFEDSALLKTFAADGLGAFPAADSLRDELRIRYGARRIGACEGVEERLYLVVAERKIANPLVQRMIARPVRR